MKLWNAKAAPQAFTRGQKGRQAHMVKPLSAFFHLIAVKEPKTGRITEKEVRCSVPLYVMLKLCS
jgi:hypothetical protein